MYYTRIRITPESQPFIFQCMLSYEEAIGYAQKMLSLLRAIDYVDIVDMDTLKTFITLNRIPNEAIPKK